VRQAGYFEGILKIEREQGGVRGATEGIFTFQEGDKKEGGRGFSQKEALRAATVSQLAN